MRFPWVELISLSLCVYGALGEDAAPNITHPLKNEPPPPTSEPEETHRHHPHRSPVYDVINQPCYAPGCGGYGQPEGYPGYRWPSRGNGYGQYPKSGPYIPRRRGGYWPSDATAYPGISGGYGTGHPEYGYRSGHPDYGYGVQSYPSLGKYGYGGYAQPVYGYGVLV